MLCWSLKTAHGKYHHWPEPNFKIHFHLLLEGRGGRRNMEKCYSMDNIILQSVLYSTWVSATGTQVFQHFIIFILAPGTRCRDEGTYTLLAADTSIKKPWFSWWTQSIINNHSSCLPDDWDKDRNIWTKTGNYKKISKLTACSPVISQHISVSWVAADSETDIPKQTSWRYWFDKKSKLTLWISYYWYSLWLI